MRRVSVALGERSYDVVVGDGAIGALGDLVAPDVRRVAVVTQAGVPDELSRLEGRLGERTVEVLEIGDGEAAKSLSTIESLTMRYHSRLLAT